MRQQSKWRLKRGKIVKNFKNFLFENNEILKKILLSKKFLKLIKESKDICPHLFAEVNTLHSFQFELHQGAL